MACLSTTKKPPVEKSESENEEEEEEAPKAYKLPSEMFRDEIFNRRSKSAGSDDRTLATTKEAITKDVIEEAGSDSQVWESKNT